jgi:hypothetical protein
MDEAVELYLAAGRPRQALALLNQHMSAAMPAAAEETATGLGGAGVCACLGCGCFFGGERRVWCMFVASLSGLRACLLACLLACLPACVFAC